MSKVVLKSNGMTLVIYKGKIQKTHYTTNNDIGFYKMLGYNVFKESINIRNKRRRA